MEASLNTSKGNLTSFLSGLGSHCSLGYQAAQRTQVLRRLCTHLPEQRAGHGADWPLSHRGGTYLILRRHRRRTDTSSVPFVLTRNQALVQLIQSS